MLKKLKEDVLTGFDVLNENRISIIPLNNIVCDALNIGICGFAIRTGKYNNILVVDVDIKNTSNPDFINKLHSTNTLTFKTPSGGFHFIFKYTDLLNIRTGIVW